MALINDIREIIKPINNINNDSLNMDNILENLIIHNNTTYNSFIFNHIIYSNNNSNTKDTIIANIKRYIDSNIKNQRIHFRDQKKKNKLSVVDFNIYFDNIYKLINKLNGMFQHIIPNTQDNNKKWGNSILWYHTINSINDILINDDIFKSSISNNMQNNNSKNPDIYRLNYYINTFSKYIISNDFYLNFIQYIDNALIEYIDAKNNMYINSIRLSNNSADINIINVNIFKILYKYYMDSYSTYYYITKNNPFNKLKEYITEHIKKIFTTNDVMFIKHFLITYIKEFTSISEHINIENIVSSFSSISINTYIEYCNELYKVTINTNLHKLILNYIETNTDKYINTFEDIMYLADLINTDIINKKHNNFYYIIGNIIKNKDEFIAAISQKLMERIIYTDVDIIIEERHVNSLSIFNRAILLKYNIILYDYRESIKFCDNNKKLIITSLDAWKINHSTGYSNNIINTEEFTTILCSKMFKYNQIYNNRNINKKLIFYPHIGSVEIEIFNRKIIVLPAHMFCLELFISFDTVLPYDLVFEKVKQNMSNYTDDFIKSIINSLIGTILINKSNNLRISTDLKNNTTIINMIDIFNNMNNTKKIIIKEIKEDLCHERETIIIANINHFIKTVDKISTTQLHTLVDTNIKHFDVDLDAFALALHKMKKYDYIEIIDNNHTVKKIHY